MSDEEIDAAAAAVNGEREQAAITAMRSVIARQGVDPDRYAYSAAECPDGTVRVEAWELGTPCPASGTYQVGVRPPPGARSYLVDWCTGASEDHDAGDELELRAPDRARSEAVALAFIESDRAQHGIGRGSG